MSTAVAGGSTAVNNNNKKAALPPREEIIQFIVSGSGSDIETVLPAPLKIPDEAIVSEIGLRSFSMYNAIPNVTLTNRNLLFKVPSSKNWVKVAYPVGAYELKAVADYLYEWIEDRYPTIKKASEEFQIEANEATSKCVIVFKKDGYGIDFDTENSIGPLLGWGTQKCQGRGIYRAPEIVNISTVSTLLFHTNISQMNWLNGVSQPYIFSCNVNVPPGFRLTREMSEVVYKKLNTRFISSIRVWLTDTSGAAINVRGETLTVSLSLRLLLSS